MIYFYHVQALTRRKHEGAIHSTEYFYRLGLDEIGSETRMRVQDYIKKKRSYGEGSFCGDGFCVVTASLP